MFNKKINGFLIPYTKAHILVSSVLTQQNCMSNCVKQKNTLFMKHLILYNLLFGRFVQTQLNFDSFFFLEIILSSIV